jgi:hypothetical protein
MIWSHGNDLVKHNNLNGWTLHSSNPLMLDKILTSLRTALHYGREGHWSRILGEFWNMIGWEWDSCLMELHYGQEFTRGELCTWMKKWHGCQHGNTFLKKDSPEVKFLGQPQSLRQKTWPSENSNLNKILSKHVLFLTFYNHFWRLGASFQAFLHAPMHSIM